MVVIGSGYKNPEKIPRSWMIKSQIRLMRICCVPSESLFSSKLDVITLNVPMQRTLLDSCKEGIDKSRLRERKKSSIVNPKPLPSRRSCRRHSCRFTKPSGRRREGETWSTDFRLSRTSSYPSVTCPLRTSRSFWPSLANARTCCPGNINWGVTGAPLGVAGVLRVSLSRRDSDHCGSSNDSPGSSRVNL